MQKPLILNPILTRIYRNDQKNYLKTKIRQMKPIVDSKCPESFYYLQNKFSKTQKNNWNCTKIDINTNNFKKIRFNQKPKKNKLKTKYRPLFKYDHDFLSYWRKNELINVAMENLNIYNRLNSKKGTYTLKNHLKDYERAQYYKKNYCKFPSIDFYRTSKASDSNLCPIFNYCTFYNYKTINDKFTNECLKRTNSQIMFKTKSVSELFNIEKNRKKKTFHLSPFKNKYNKNEEVKSEKNNVKHIFNNVRNDIYKNSGKSKDIKKEEDKKEEIPENNENNNVVNKEEDNINQNNNINDDIIDENIKKDNENNNSNNSLKNLEDEIINTNDINDNNDKNDNNDINDNKEMIPNSNNKLSSNREEISEKIDEEEVIKEQKIVPQKRDEQNYNFKENSKIKEESEIEESIDNDKDKNKNKEEIVGEKKEEINEEKKEENDKISEEKIIEESNKIKNNEDDEDKFVDVLDDV